MKTINWRVAWLATRIFISAIGLLALGIWFTEPFGWAWRTASVIVLGIAWYLIYRISAAFTPKPHARQKAVAASPSHRPATAPLSLRQPPFELRKPPKSARYIYTLTEDGIPRHETWDKKEADGWLGLGPQFDFEYRNIPAEMRA